LLKKASLGNMEKRKFSFPSRELKSIDLSMGKTRKSKLAPGGVMMSKGVTKSMKKEYRRISQKEQVTKKAKKNMK